MLISGQVDLDFFTNYGKIFNLNVLNNQHGSHYSPHYRTSHPRYPAHRTRHKIKTMDANIIIRQSTLPVKQTIDKLETFLRQQGITIYARIDQQAEAARSGVTLPPLETLTWISPRVYDPGGIPAAPIESVTKIAL